jgi:hypothetical protein
MDLADASFVTAAEALGTRRVFTIDRNDFETYRVRPSASGDPDRLLTTDGPNICGPSADEKG